MAMNISRLSSLSHRSLSMSKGVAIGAIALILVACGGDSTSGGNASAESDLMVSTYDDLPVCSDAREGVMAYVKDKRVAYVCVEGDWTIEEGSSSLEDGQAGAVKNKSISGVSQKGPFVKGAQVTAYELDGSKSLLQTGRTFSGNITQDDGRFNLSNVTLKSSYVRLSANGYYRNEVTGENSTSPITLNAVTDLSSRNTVNINLLTHLEFDRVARLMAESDGTLKIKTAKKQAEKEIFDAFHIDATGFGYSEDLDVFGNTEADAALLAISIMLQGDRTESELTELLAELSEDLSDGKWDDDAKRAEIADSALSKDTRAKLINYRSNVKNWGLSSAIPNFEKYVRTFWSIESGLGLCGSDSTPVGTVKQVQNSNLNNYAKSYTDTTSVGKKIRYICVDADSAKWREATDLEKDRFNWKPVNAKDGTFLTGPVTGRKMVWDADTIRYAINTEVNGGKGCTSYNRDELFVFDKHYSYYKCTESGWIITGEKLITGTLIDSRDGKIYKTIGIGSQNWMAENLNFTFERDSHYGYFPSYVVQDTCYNNDATNCTKYGRLYTWAAAIKACPAGWHLPNNTEWTTLYNAIGGRSTAVKVLKSTSGWSRNGNGTDTFGFSALPAGFWDGYDLRNFRDENYCAYFWSSTTRDDPGAYFMALCADLDSVYSEAWGKNNHEFSVRCLQD